MNIECNDHYWSLHYALIEWQERRGHDRALHREVARDLLRRYREQVRRRNELFQRRVAEARARNVGRAA